MPLTRLLWGQQKIGCVGCCRRETHKHRAREKTKKPNKSSQSEENEAKRRFLCIVLHSFGAQWPNEREQREQKKHRRRKMERIGMK